MKRICFSIIVLAMVLVTHALKATDYYVHPKLGNDSNDGLSKAHPFKTLQRASELKLVAGDRLLLAHGEIYYGTLELKKLEGSDHLPIQVESIMWSENDAGKKPALIDAKSLLQGILVLDCRYIKISNLQITANGFVKPDSTQRMRVGVVVEAKGPKGVKGVTLDHLKIFDVFYENPGAIRNKEEVKTANGTKPYGWGIRLMNTKEDILLESVLIQDCEIENVSHTGIKLTGAGRSIQNVKIIRNKVLRTGGPGVQMSNVKFIYVADNEINGSGSPDDSRKWGRGSGLWTWSASNILIEKNKFLNANGPGDSAGAHIDYNCDNVVLQYNLSANNAGGFCEVLGNNYNCAYRYNISVNDGYRIKGKDGAFQEGKTFWLSGYQGNKDRKGPVNTYFYNNTIYVNEVIESKIAIDNRSDGILIANNIFYVMGKSSAVKGDQYKPDTDNDSKTINRVIFKNNLYLKKDTWPAATLIQDSSPLFGDPQFRNGGSLNPEDYTPTNAAIGRGIEIPALPGDEFGLLFGMKAKKDFLDHEITGTPGLGAINY